MASICNDDLASLGVMSGHERKTLRLSAWSAGARAGQAPGPLASRLRADIRLAEVAVLAAQNIAEPFIEMTGAKLGKLE